MDVLAEKQLDRIKPGVVTKDAPPEKDTTEPVLVLLTVPSPQPGDSMEAQLERLKHHNRVATEVVLAEPGGNGRTSFPRILGYADGGVMVAFDPKERAQALLVATKVTRKVREGDKRYSSDPQIGLALGRIESRAWNEGAPEDQWGEPIEIARRLASEIAVPGQIVLDSTACHEEDLDLVKKNHPDAELHPLSGIKLTIQGTEERRVSELALDGNKRVPQNRRQLVRELNQIQVATMMLRFQLQDANVFGDHIGGSHLEAWPEPDIEQFQRLVNGLDPEIGHEAETLQRVWKNAKEAKREDVVDKAYEDFDSAVAALQRIWVDKESAVRDPEGGSAARECLDAKAGVINRLQNLSRKVAAALKQIDETL